MFSPMASPKACFWLASIQLGKSLEMHPQREGDIETILWCDFTENKGFTISQTHQNQKQDKNPPTPLGSAKYKVTNEVGGKASPRVSNPETLGFLWRVIKLHAYSLFYCPSLHPKGRRWYGISPKIGPHLCLQNSKSDSHHTNHLLSPLFQYHRDAIILRLNYQHLVLISTPSRAFSDRADYNVRNIWVIHPSL